MRQIGNRLSRGDREIIRESWLPAPAGQDYS